MHVLFEMMSVLGGSWVVINGVISRATIHIRGLTTPLITTNEPPSRVLVHDEHCRASGLNSS